MEVPPFYIFLFLLPGFAYSQDPSPIGGPCGSPADCSPNDSTCDLVTGLCRCNDDFVSSDDKLECLPIVNDHEGPCREVQQCTSGDLGIRSRCFSQKCVCVPEAIYVPGTQGDKCLLKADHVSDPCLEDLQCSTNLGDDASCVSSKCTCDPTQSIPRKDGTFCLHKVDTIGGSCEETGQCLLGEPGEESQCSLGKCVCRNTAIPVGNTCYPKSGLGKTCIVDAQCSENGDPLVICSVGVCRCKPDEAVENGAGTGCLRLATRIGEDCSESPQCILGRPGQYSTCYRDEIGKGSCQCTSEALEIPGNPTCQRKATHTNDTCLIHEQCTINLGSLAICEEGLCLCKPGSVPSSTRTRCLPGGILIGQPCEDEAQCVDAAECTQTGHCSCPEDFVPDGNLLRCLKVINFLNEECEEAQQCQKGKPGPWSDCLEKYVGGSMKKVCLCKPEAISGARSHVCLKTAEFLGDSCIRDDQCFITLGSAWCIGGSCTCHSDYGSSADMKKCVVKSSLGKPAIQLP